MDGGMGEVDGRTEGNKRDFEMIHHFFRFDCLSWIFNSYFRDLGSLFQLSLYPKLSLSLSHYLPFTNVRPRTLGQLMLVLPSRVRGLS